MCCRKRPLPTERGFTLLEIQIALLLLALATFGYVKLAGAQSSMVNAVDGWCRGEPTFIVAPAARETERQLGVPASLIASDEEPPGDVPTPDGENEVTVLSVSHGLDPATATALVQVLVPEEEDEAEDETDAEDAEEDAEEDPEIEDGE
ncbi:MAG: prepilin-type N-terminal cleavage/methylation domain-containing protein [Planctomycetota bacterium]|nr:prepilin-type N-terminal cleavage/methylation domain-containing protein [Planctomycetota bacterium]